MKKFISVMIIICIIAAILPVYASNQIVYTPDLNAKFTVDKDSNVKVYSQNHNAYKTGGNNGCDISIDTSVSSDSDGKSLKLTTPTWKTNQFDEGRTKLYNAFGNDALTDADKGTYTIYGKVLLGKSLTGKSEEKLTVQVMGNAGDYNTKPLGNKTTINMNTTSWTPFTLEYEITDENVSGQVGTLAFITTSIYSKEGEQSFYYIDELKVIKGSADALVETPLETAVSVYKPDLNAKFTVDKDSNVKVFSQNHNAYKTGGNNGCDISIDTSVSSDSDGKSLKLTTPTWKTNQFDEGRTKLYNAFGNDALTDADKGTYTIYGKVLLGKSLTGKSEEKLTVQVMGNAGDYNTKPLGNKTTISMNTTSWTPFTLEYEITDENVAGQVGTLAFITTSIYSKEGEQSFYYIDELEVFKGTNINKEETPSAPVIPSTPVNNEIKISINGEYKTFDQMPVIVEGRTLVPMRGIFEALGMEVNWDDLSKTAIGKKDGKEIKITIGSTTAYVNGEAKTLDVGAQIINSRTMVPVRFISESLGAKVDWDGDLKTVYIQLATVLRRNVPKSTLNTGKDLNNLVYYGDDRNPDEVVAALPEGEVLISNEDLFSFKGLKSLEGYGKAEIVEVSHENFNKAYRVTMEKVPGTPYSTQLTFSVPKKFEKGDVVLMTAYMRTIDGGLNETDCGEAQFVLEQDGGYYSKALQGSMTPGKDWTKAYFACEINRNDFLDATRVTIRLGYHVQTIEIAGFSLINYKNKVKIEDMPNTVSYSGGEKDANWRYEANERIEKIRKGDINVIVKDKNGNLVPNAKVDVNMYEHEFKFGTSVYQAVLENEEYKNAITSLFNGAVFEVEHKWNEYEKDPSLSKRMTDLLKSNGVKHIRGHFWFPSRKGAYTPDSSQFPQDLPSLYDNKDAFFERVKNHVLRVGNAFKGEYCHWDVMNEITKNPALVDQYGAEYMKLLYETSRQVDPNTKLYVTETGINRAGSEQYVGFTKHVDTLVNNNIPFDGIGIQGHLSTFDSPQVWYDMIESLYQKYGKEISITEFDMDTDNEDAQANYTRDILIATFSNEHVDGFYMWGFWDGIHWLGNAPVYKKDWTLKKSGEQFIDLVYNKWWTNESGTTDENGEFNVRGYYGDYDITVTLNGTSKTVSVPCYKGNDNTIYITLD